MAHSDIGSPLTDQEIDDLLHEYVHSNPASPSRTPPLPSASIDKMKSKSPTPGNGKRVHIDAPNSTRRSVKDEDHGTSSEVVNPPRKSARTKKRLRDNDDEAHDDEVGKGASSSKKKVVRRGPVAAWEPEEDKWFWRDVLEQYKPKWDELISNIRDTCPDKDRSDSAIRQRWSGQLKKDLEKLAYP